ncbi:MAG: hypothetical protein KA436_05835 [Oligoflexales bacterium]|nr:hypothetical protein [Oligoflexales bacterium]
MSNETTKKSEPTKPEWTEAKKSELTKPEGSKPEAVKSEWTEAKKTEESKPEAVKSEWTEAKKKEESKPEAVKSDWTETRGKIKAKFGRLSDEAIDSLKGNLDLLSAKLQSVYGYAKEKADSELVALKGSMRTAAVPMKKEALAAQK